MDWKKNKLGLISVLTGAISLIYFLYSLFGIRFSYTMGYQPIWMAWLYLFMFLLLPLISFLTAFIARSDKEKQIVLWKVGLGLAVLDLILFFYMLNRFLYHLAY